MRSHSTARLLVSILFLFVFANSYGQCNANAGPNKTKCAGAPVTLGAGTAASGNAPFTYSWTPATGLSCTNCANPVCTSTVFTVYTLTITDDNGCTDSDNVNVNITPAPNANFTFTGNNGCGSTPIQFTSTSTGSGLTYAWNFGNPVSGSANTSSQTNPQHEFVSVGTGTSSFNVSLIVTNAAGCKDTMIQTVTVQQTPGPVIVDPIASFKNCDGSNYNMTIYDASATVGANYTIIWGDGSPNFTATTFPGAGANHLYSTSDIFDLYYIVTGANGCSDTVHQLVSNITNPAIGAANPGATTGCGPMTLCFPLSNYSANHSSTYYVVDYGDSSPLDTLPHPPPAVICHTYTTSSCGQPGNAYTFKMKAINSCDSSLASISPIRVYSGPQANFTAPASGCVGSAITFLNTSVLGFNSSCSASTLFTWNFGDGQTLTTIAFTSPSHVYTVPGNYTVTLSTQNACGTTTHSANVCIESPPVPNFTLLPATACVPFNTQVTNLSTVINACNVTYTWSVIFNGSTCAPSTGTWNFINSTNATSFAPEFQFVSPGQYTVRLTMTNSCGTFIFDQPVVGQAPPQVSLAGLPSICAGTSVSPTAVVNNCYEPVDTYSWSFVGGSPSSSNLLIPGPVLYANPGSYSVQLQATNVCGSITATTPLIVFAPPVANAGPDVQFCSGGSSVIGSAPVGGVSYSWSPTTGLSSPSISASTVSLTNATAAPTVNQYVVTASSSASCFTKDTVLVTVNPLPILVVNSPTICLGQSANLTVSGAGAGGNYNWSPSTALSCTNCASPISTPTTTTVYTITGTNVYGCLSSITSTVTVNPLPVVNAGPDQTLCNQAIPVTLSGTPVGGTWTGSPNVTSAGIFTPNGVELAQLVYSYTNPSTLCTNTDTLIVTVNPPVIPTLDPLDSLCINAAITNLNTLLNVNPLGGAWSGTGVTNPNFNPATAGVGSHPVTYTFGTGTCLVQVTSSINVNPLPVISVNSGTICAGQNLSLVASGAGVGGSYSWTPATNLSCTSCPNPLADPLLTISYTVTGTNAFGCSSSAISTVTVNPLPVVSAGPDQLLCDQAIPYTLTGTPSGGTWTGSPNVTSAGIFTPNGSEVSTLYYSYTVLATGCSQIDSMVVTVSPPVVPTVNPTYSICVNSSSVNLNTELAPSPLGGTWSGTGVTNPLFNPSTAGVGSFTVTYSYGSATCLNTVNSIITVNPEPSLLVNSATICNTDSVNLLVAGAGAVGTYSWSPSATLSCSNCDSLYASPSTTTTYTVTGTNSFGCSSSANSIVTVNPLPVVSAGPDLTLCNQAIPVTLAGTTAGGSWTGSSNVSAGGIFTPNGVEVVVLYYTYTNPATSCSNIDSTIITVNPLVVPTVDPTYALCSNNASFNLTTTLNANPVGGIWSGTGVTNPNFIPATAGVGTHTLNYAYGTGTCLSTTTTQITVYSQPTLSVNNATICNGQSTALSASGAGAGGNYSWSPGTALSCTNCSNSTANPTNSIVYTVTGTTTEGCSNTAISTITVNALPLVNAGIDQTLCDQPIPVSLLGTPLGGTWSGSPNVTLGGVFTPNGPETSTLYYTYTISATGCINLDSMIMTVVPPVIPTIDPTFSLCVYEPTINLNTILNPSQLGGTWSGTGVTNPTFNPLTAGVGTHTVTYSYGAGTCLNLVTSVITVNPQPTVSVNSGVICNGQSIVLNANGAGVGGNYSWTPTTALSCTTCDTPTANPTNTTTYTVTGTTALGCSNTANSIVTVNPLPVVNAGNDTTLCNLPIPVQFTGTIAGGTWTGTDVNSTGLFSPTSVGTFTLTYTVTLGTGCTASDSKDVQVVAPIFANAGLDAAYCIDQVNATVIGLPSGGTWTGTNVNASGLFTINSAGNFPLVYTTGAGNCLTRDTMIMTIHALPVVNAGNDLEFCLTDAAQNLVGTPSGGTWTGTGITNASLGTFDPQVATVGLHQIVYSYIDPITTCVNTDTLYVDVHPLPVVSFNFSPIICETVAETFNNTSTLVNSTQWNFGDGSGSTVNSPSHSFATIGFYPIQAIVTTLYGCVDSLTQTIEVREVPVPNFVLTPDSSCGPVSVNFTNNSTGIGLSYAWDFGNGQTSTLQNPGAVTYVAGIVADTIYTIELAVTNMCGTVYYYDSVIVMPSPTAIFGPDFNSGCSPFTANFASVSLGLPDSYYWDFGNGVTSATTDSLFQQTYTTGSTPTDYTIMLVVINECGTDTAYHTITVTPNNVNAFFNTSATTACNNLTVNFTQYTLGGTLWSWDFGDGTTSSQYSPSHTYSSAGTYNVSLFANDGCSFDTANVTIIVNQSPVVDFSVLPDSVCINTPFSFINESIGAVSSYWTFGDGTNSNITSPTHVYGTSGNYQVTLVGTSLLNGCTASVTQTVHVSVNPVSQFTLNPSNGCVPLDVQFTNQSSGAAFYSWDFGDGNTSVLPNPNHTYSTVGVFTAQLIVENVNGCLDTSYQNVTVHGLPTVNFTASYNCTAPVTIDFTNLSTGAIGYSWDFGNGQTSTLTNPIGQYMVPGNYTVTLTAMNQYGCQEIAQQVVTVYPVPTINFVSPAVEICADSMLSFTANTTADSVIWNLGDGTFITGNPISYSYQQAGNYLVSAIAYGGEGCTASAVSNATILIHPQAIADFDYENILNNDQSNGMVAFENNSLNATSFLWNFGDGQSSTEFNPTHLYNGYNFYTATLYANNSFGCDDSMTIVVDVDYFHGLFLPSAIYPGHSSYEVSHFVPKGVGLKEFELLIYDDWGNLIWETTALDANGRPTEAWDGTFNGEPVQQDAYVWKVTAVFIDESVWEGKEYKKKKFKKAGTVTVIR